MSPIGQLLPPALIAAGYGGLVAVLAGYWQAELSAVDRYLVLCGAAWAWASRWRDATGNVGPRPLPALPVVAIGSVLYPIAWAGYFVLLKGRTLPLWAMWLALTLVAVGWLLARFGPRAVCRLLFPLLFVGFALPPPGNLLQNFQHALQAITTESAARTLGLIGYPVGRPAGGFLLSLPGGDLGVEESCSGVKALTALTAMAAFVAFRRQSGVVRGVLLVMAAVPVVLAVNVLRVVLSGFIQETAGADYIRGGWHDALGFGTVLVGLVVILRVGQWIAPRSPGVTATALPTPVLAKARPTPAERSLPLLLFCSLLATLAVAWHGRSRLPEAVPSPPFGEFSSTLGDWVEHSRPAVPPHVRELLQPDAILYREYRNGVGRSATVWVIYWATPDGARGGYHHPDVCLPNVGYQETARGELRIQPVAGGEVPITSRTLRGVGGDLYVLYWTQTGRRVWGPADEEEAMVSFLPERVLAQAVASWVDRTPPEPAGRLVVLIGSPHPTDFGRGEVERFARLVADEVYRLCPSAAVPMPPERPRP